MNGETQLIISAIDNVRKDVGESREHHSAEVRRIYERIENLAETGGAAMQLHLARKHTGIGKRVLATIVGVMFNR